MKYWVEVLDKEVNRIQEEHREVRRMAEIEKFVEASGQSGYSFERVDSFVGGVVA